uniref:sorting nexin-2-like n=1 Tax=Ciona intestinalis TaxID=7719 RepID=UPI000180B30C|nr:sorting nexin-2-like [Ciona intestinalis]|eukprot:XP_002130718.1 sorting nexin-2-like [Ciona intestinalis]
MSDSREPPPFDDEETEEVGSEIAPVETEINLDDDAAEKPVNQEESVKQAEVVSQEEVVTKPTVVTEPDPVPVVKEAAAPEPVKVEPELLDDDDDDDMFESASASANLPNISIEVPTKYTDTAKDDYSKASHSSQYDSKVNDITIQVSDPHKVGDGMNAYMSYRVRTKTSIPSFKRAELAVDRRFSDFLGIHEKLLAKHRHAGRIVPPAPEKSIVGMTLIKMSKTDEEAVSIDFVEKRRAALERYLNRVARHNTLVQDQDFRDFLEQEELPQATNTRALSGAGVMRLVKNVEGALSKITIKMTEEDSWFEEKQQQIESLEQQLRKLHASFESLVHHRKELAVNTALFAKSSATLGNAEEHTALSRALAQLSDAFEKIENVHQEQSNTDYYAVAETLADYLRIITEIKEIFMVRVKSWQNWQNAEQNVQRKKEAEAKMQASGRTDKIAQIQADIKELEARVQTCKSDFDELSAEIKKEMQAFEQDRVVDFRQLVLIFLKNLMKSQEQNIKNWEAFMPEARAIA